MRTKIDITKAPLGDESDAGFQFEWTRHADGLLLKAKRWVENHLLQGDDATEFLQQTGVVNHLWNVDPNNTEGRVFKTREDHLDAIAEPYFGILPE